MCRFLRFLLLIIIIVVIIIFINVIFFLTAASVCIQVEFYIVELLVLCLSEDKKKKNIFIYKK